jgi:deoxyribose-phosphate aldolase
MDLTENELSRIVEKITRSLLSELRRGDVVSEDIEAYKESAENLELETSFNPQGEIIRVISRNVGEGEQPEAEPEMAGLIDHTLLKPGATVDQIIELCGEAEKYGFASVCVNPVHVPLCASLLAGSPPAVCTVIGFPLGASAPEIKALEARKAISQGAAEVDMVLNIGALKSGDLTLAARDIQGVVLEAHRSGALVKVIIETSLLTENEKVLACLIAKHAGADYVKTSTGFSGGGATAEDVRLMRQVVGLEMGVKASGGVRTIEDARRMVEAGATRIGASSGVAIVQGAVGDSDY